jgi:CRP/FNR family cyclic AMP-dependent transcriptional regulator
MIRHSETLAHVPLFRSLAAEEIRRLDTQCIWRRAKAGECVLDYGDGGTDLYFVSRCALRVLIRSNSGKESILCDIGDGEYFGELAAIDGRPRSASIIATADSIIARMPPSIFFETVHRCPDVCDQLLAQLASQIRVLANRVNEYGTLDVRSRLYAELLRLARPAGSSAGQAASAGPGRGLTSRQRQEVAVGPGDRAAESVFGSRSGTGTTSSLRAVISPPPTHAELAARVATHREAVTRELNSLERSGLLERRRGALVLLDTAQLADLIAQAAK